MGVLTGIALGSLIAGTVVKAKAHHKQGKEAQRVAEANAAAAEDQAVDTSRLGVEKENAFRREVRGQLGAQTAGYAAQGVNVTGGTAQALRTQGEQLLQSDLARIRRNAEREALGYKAEATEYRQQGKYAKSAAKYNMWGTILGGAADSSLLASRMEWKKPKPATGGGP